MNDSGSINTVIRIKPQTRQKLDQVRARRGWNVMEAADRAADALVERETGKEQRRRSRQPQSAS